MFTLPSEDETKKIIKVRHSDGRGHRVLGDTGENVDCHHWSFPEQEPEPQLPHSVSHQPKLACTNLMRMGNGGNRRELAFLKLFCRQQLFVVEDGVWVGEKGHNSAIRGHQMLQQIHS